MWILPRLLLVTDRRISFLPLALQLSRALRPIEKNATDGIRRVGVLFREKDLRMPDRLQLARQVAEAVFCGGAGLIVATSGTFDGGSLIAKEVEAEGLHLSSWAPIPKRYEGVCTMGRSCHSAGEYLRATLEGMDYATISPVFDSFSKRGMQGRGLDLISDVTAKVILERSRHPAVYALGGIAPGNIASCIEAGAFGVAVCGAIMRARDPDRVLQLALSEIQDAVSAQGRDR